MEVAGGSPRSGTASPTLRSIAAGSSRATIRWVWTFPLVAMLLAMPLDADNSLPILQYGKQEVAFVVPASISRPDDVILPRSQIAWMMDQPDDVLSANDAHSHILHSPYNFLGHDLDRDAFASRAMHKYLARHLTSLIPGVEDEVDAAVNDVMGLDTENWTKVNLWDMWLAIVPRVTNRLLVGNPVCREDRFLKSMVKFVDDVIRNSFLLKMFPLILHPIVGRLLAIPNWLHWRAANRFVMPIIKQRLHDMEQKELGNPEYKEWTPPEDFITWDIRLARLERNSFELNPDVISKRMLPIEFAAIHTTALTGQSWMLDLLSTNPEDGVLDVLRDELSANKPTSGEWTKSGLASLLRLDSSIRESQRLSNFASTLVERQVTAREGLHNPTFGWTLPYGAFVTVNLEGTHHDDELYPGSQGYDPWRYSRIREAWEEKSEDERQKSPEDGSNARRLGMVTTSPQHLAFGHGRHACPGRFFVAHELKLIMAAILLKYDIKMIDKRPQPEWFGATIIPPLETCVEIRRKPGTT
ncbi:cytochrome P450 [Dactylonectria macrodidyma]|uniref:Cytochrome P450 n=1 Tax=Dactylonectria macrodidyma TaxID=307937 RepID=A0A9P9JCP3_9HYPO|nr:cytochrome P450 [Dactylonectria macrodidyma]